MMDSCWPTTKANARLPTQQEIPAAFAFGWIHRLIALVFLEAGPRRGIFLLPPPFFSKPSPVALLVMDTVGEAGDEMRRGVMRAGGSERE